MDKLPRYIVKSGSGYAFRLIVPTELQEQFGQKVIKRSLRTTDPRQAQVWALLLADRYHQAFSVGRRQNVSKTLDELLASAEQAMGNGTGKTYVIEPTKYGPKVTTDGTAEDHARAMQALQAMPAQTVLPSAQDIASIVPKGIKRVTLTKAIREYMERIKPPIENKSKLKTYNGPITKSLADFEAWAKGKALVHQITRHDLAQHTTFLLKKNLAKSTVRDRLSYIKTFFDFCISSSYYPKGDNPAQGHITITKQDRRQSVKNGWQQFDTEQLKKLFDPANFGGLDKDETRWVAILSLYTGARPNELCQLDIADCKSYAGFDCIEITSVGIDKRTKNEASERYIPLHPDLIKLGFLEKVEAEKMAGHTALFPDLNRKTLNGPANTVGKDFTAYLKKLDIKARGTGKIGVRSLRPTVITEMAESSVPQGWREIFVGHEQTEGVTSSDHHLRYTKSQLVKVVAEKCLPTLDWSKKGIVDIPKLKKFLK